MTSYRNQHYVPVFHLEGWATDERIVIFHFESENEIPNQDINKICSRYYFYTSQVDTTLEESLGELEGLQAKPLRKLREGGFPTELNSTEKSALYSYVLTQRLRTRSYRKELREGGKQVFEVPFSLRYSEIFDDSHELNLDEKTRELMKENFIEEAIRHNHLYLMIHGFLGLGLRDLDMLIAENETNFEFICSDSPIIFDNIRFKHERDQYYPGIGNRGLLVYCPVSPNRLLILYDPLVYTFAHDAKQRIKISEPEVVDMLNRFQVMYADDIVIYSHQSKADELIEFRTQSEKLARIEGIPRTIETELFEVEYEIPPYQPLPDTANFFNDMIVNPHIDYDVNRNEELTDKSASIAQKLEDSSDTFDQAAKRAIRISIDIINQQHLK